MDQQVPMVPRLELEPVEREEKIHNEMREQASSPIVISSPSSEEMELDEKDVTGTRRRGYMQIEFEEEEAEEDSGKEIGEPEWEAEDRSWVEELRRWLEENQKGETEKAGQGERVE